MIRYAEILNKGDGIAVNKIEAEKYFNNAKEKPKNILQEDENEFSTINNHDQKDIFPNEVNRKYQPKKESTKNNDDDSPQTKRKAQIKNDDSDDEPQRKRKTQTKNDDSDGEIEIKRKTQIKNDANSNDESLTKNEGQTNGGCITNDELQNKRKVHQNKSKIQEINEHNFKNDQISNIKPQTNRNNYSQNEKITQNEN